MLKGDRYFPVEGKKPLNWMTGRYDDAGNREMWLSRELAEAVGVGDGIAYSMWHDCEYWCLDIDRYEHGFADELTLWLLEQTKGCMVELSQSGKGMHVWGRGELPPGRRVQNEEEHVALYSDKRYIRLGTLLEGDPETVVDMSAIVERLFAKAPQVERVERGCVADRTDEEVLELALSVRPSAKQVFAGKLTFAELWAGDEGENPSVDDMSLASRLAFYSGRNEEQVERMMWASGRVRDKWHIHRTYVRDTVRKAIALCDKVWEDRSVAVAEGERPVGKLMNGSEQAEYFKGCVAVLKDNMVWTPDYGLLNEPSFNKVYGRNSFYLMKDNSDKPRNNAWEAFHQSQVFVAPLADAECFRPSEPPGKLIEHCGKTLVNIYQPIKTPSEPGDISVWLDHFKLMYPVESDREQITSYMAAVVQYPGKKFQWAPVLQSAHGTGKNMLSECVAQAIGDAYVQRIRPSTLDSQFNGWLRGCIFAMIDEVMIKSGECQKLEQLKLLITGGRGIAIEAKGKDQYTSPICTNFIFTTNWKNAIPKAKTERRFAVYYGAHQTAEEIERDDIPGRIKRMWVWLEEENGFAYVTHYLQNYRIRDALNPAVGCQVAPRTSVHDESCSWAQNKLEASIQTAVEMDLDGFRGSWVSSGALGAWLKDNRLLDEFPSQRWAPVLEAMGYRRVTGQVRAKPTGGLSRLYYKGEEAPLLAQAPDLTVRDRYEAAQTPAPDNQHLRINK